MGFEDRTENTREALISLTQKFIKVLDELYEKGSISKEQYEDMIRLKREFLNAQL